MTGVRTVTLAEFLLARIAEDEALFRAAGPQWSEIGGYMLPGFTEQRAVAECEAKRRIVGLHQTDMTPGIGGIPRPYCAECGSDEYPGPFPCPTLCLLALPYADHPDYRPEWKPDTPPAAALPLESRGFRHATFSAIDDPDDLSWP